MTRPASEVSYWSVPRCWPGETVAILAGGKSLTQEQVDHCRGRCRVIAINRRHETAPWADWLYGCDIERFWQWCMEARTFAGVKIAVRHVQRLTGTYLQQMQELAAAGVKILCHSARGDVRKVIHTGVSDDPGVVYGNNSLFQVLSVLAHTGAAKVVLLGADMRGGRGYDYGKHKPAEPAYASSVVPMFASLVEPLRERGIEVVNCTPGSLIECWPNRPVEDVV